MAVLPSELRSRYFVCWNATIFVAVFAIVSAEKKVPVSVYYESLCPDSIAFITKQLVPTLHSRLRDHVDLELVPYGKASHHRSSAAEGQKWEFKCHHGPVECYGNKVQGCILKHVRSEDDKIKYVDCLMNQAKTTKSEYPIGRCVTGADLGVVTTCANGTNGADILAANGDETERLNPPLTSVPTVVFNRTFNKTEQDMAQKNFKNVLCSYLKEDCLSECSSAASVSLSALAALTSLAIFLVL